MATEAELAWAAGFFDGEGSVRSTAERHRIITVQNTDLGLLERLQRALGVGTIKGPVQRDPKWKPIWRWDASAANALAAAETLLPYVGERNRLRLTALCEAYRADKSGVCEHCGDQFPRIHRDRRFCGSSCKAKAFRARQAREQIGVAT